MCGPIWERDDAAQKCVAQRAVSIAFYSSKPEPTGWKFVEQTNSIAKSQKKKTERKSKQTRRRISMCTDFYVPFEKCGKRYLRKYPNPLRKFGRSVCFMRHEMKGFGFFVLFCVFGVT